ncbi:dATP/dGTP pyrophosphohydrolase domain-containing protein [Pelagibius sp. Alg239-R121]|uniref:MazG-like family protein n=1 Tax=Pelagibius sp. Alg239-R121 TaxID=2993448 RepID=UPI0024A6533A|nr:dATP/dGTP pyrophosphohydrolase domain-containing protein [Pelagibius sp. Alg239-R121]
MSASRDQSPITSENQASIAAWGQATFGLAKNPIDLVTRAQQELAELAEAVSAGQPPEAAMETADVMILLYRLAEDLGYDLNESVARKMAVNRARKWIRAGDGTGQHVETL